MPQQILPEPEFNLSYFQRLAALLEPDAIEYPRYNAFTYTVGSNETKYFLLGWATYVDPNTSARYDVRLPNDPLPLRNITIKGSGAGSTGVFLDPALPVYADARETYYDRLAAIAALPTKHVWDAGTSNNNFSPLLPGPYGSIVTSVMCFDYAWVALTASGVATTGFPIDYELADSTSAPIRFAHTMRLPITKAFVGGIMTGYPNNANARGVITYVILPATWSVIADPLAPYDFRDDFMGASLDTSTIWTRAQSTAGNVEIDTNFAWLKLVGSGSWNANGAFTQQSFSRTNGRVLLMDVHVSTSGNIAVGWHDGAGHDVTDFAHAVEFGSDGATIYLKENGTTRATLSSAYTRLHNYRVRLTLGTSGACTYEIQGGPQYNQIGSPTWNTLSPGTTSSATDPLHAGAAAGAGTSYVGDVRVY